MVKKGQHFLINHFFLNLLCKEAYLTKKDIVWEIGTGVGNLTKYLARRVRKVYTIEIDKDLYFIAKDKLENFNSVFQILGDALEIFPFEDVNKIVTNPPFEISSKLIELFAKFLVNQGELVVSTFQKEVVLKILAKPKTKNFGSLSFFARYYMKPEYLFRIPPKAYSPVPKVEIIAIRFMKKNVKWDEKLNKFIRKLYLHKKWNVDKVLKKEFNLNINYSNKKVFQLDMQEVLDLYYKIKDDI